MIPAKQFDLCPWGKLIAMPHMGWQHAGWFASYVVNAKNILEWGCGGSTLWMAMMNPKAQLHIVERDGVWLDRVGDVLLALRATTVDVSVNVLLSECQDLVSYVCSETFKTKAPYDLIFVDGHERPACMEASYDLLAPGGVVFLHDSERAAYTDAKRMLLEREGMAEVFHTEARGKERAFQTKVEARDTIGRDMPSGECVLLGRLPQPRKCVSGNDWQDESWVNPIAGMWAAQKL